MAGPLATPTSNSPGLALLHTLVNVSCCLGWGPWSLRVLTAPKQHGAAPHLRSHLHLPNEGHWASLPCSPAIYSRPGALLVQALQPRGAATTHLSTVLRVCLQIPGTSSATRPCPGPLLHIAVAVLPPLSPGEALPLQEDFCSSSLKKDSEKYRFLAFVV